MWHSVWYFVHGVTVGYQEIQVKYGSFHPKCWQLVQPYQKAQKLRWTYLLIWPQHFVFLLRQSHCSQSTGLFIVHEQYVLSVHTKRVAKCRALIDTRLYQREYQCMHERRSWRRYLSAIFHQDVVRNNQKAMQRSIEHVDDATREHNLLSAFIRKRTLFYVLLSK